ncbi:MAG: helical backbone metal receptor [Oscillospiraceae bacterium]|nr:helical backbone metal receptor [Oscillospiraceae bacterium]
MNIFSKKLLAAAICGVMLLTGCDNTQQEPSEIVVSDGIPDPAPVLFPCDSCGVTLESAVQKAVSLSPAATEIICELGFKDCLLGISSYCDYPEGLSAKVVGSSENPDIDAVIELKPDAVFTLSPLSEREVYALNQAGIAVLSAPVPVDVDGYSALYREISAAFYGKETGLDGVRRSVRTGSEARGTLEKAAGEVRMESFIYITGKLTFAGADTFEGAVLGLSGENICTHSGYISLEDYWEELRQTPPAYMIVDDSLTEEEIRESATLTLLLETGTKLRFVSSRCFERPSARTAEVFAALKNGESK